MRLSLRDSVVIFLFTGLIIIYQACKKEEPKSFPVLTTSDVTYITTITAVGGGNITSDGGSAIVENGVCWNTSVEPTINDSMSTVAVGPADFSCDITGLMPNSIYYLRAYATNKDGTGYGNEVTFQAYAVMDPDSNFYHSATIGPQVWMTENLRTTRYNDSTEIPLVTDNFSWLTLTTPAYCWYENNIENKNIYGGLYNWYTINTGILCPSGWHVPVSYEWSYLRDEYLGGYEVAGGKLKAIGSIEEETGFWYLPNAGATNETGFSAVPGGTLNHNFGTFENMGYFGYYWLSDELDSANGFRFGTNYDTPAAGFAFEPKNGGLSVRCIKDN
jgi:uncharacterized protein (TIGR02145 family)